MSDRYTNFVIQHHKWFVFSVLIVILSLVTGATKLKVTNEFRIYFSKDNPQLASFEKFESIFGREDTVYFYIQTHQNDIFDQQVLTLIWQLSEDSWDIPYATRVTSITNYQHTEAKDDNLDTHDLVQNPLTLDSEKIAKIKRIALSEPTLLHRVIPPEGNATGINVRLDLPQENLKAANEAVAHARNLAEKYRKLFPQVTLLVSGGSTAGVTLGEAVEQDLNSLVIISYILIMLLLLVLLRSIIAAIIVMILITLATAGTMGIFGWLGTTLTPVAGWVPSIIMTMAVADAVHILISYYYALRHGSSQHDAVREAMRINISPVFITSITTIIGMLCLNFSDSPPYRTLGNMVAVGVFIAFLLSMTLLPALLAWFPSGKYHKNKGSNISIDRLAEFVIRFRYGLLISMGILVAILSSFIGNNQLTERWQEYFDESFEVRQSIEAINENLSGVHLIRYVLDSGKPEGIFEPEFLNSVEAFANWFREQHGVAYVTSLADTIKRLNQTMHNNDPKSYTIPQERKIAAQLYLLYDMGIPPELNLNDLVDPERQSLLLLAILKKTDSEELLNMDKKAQAWLSNNAAHLNKSEGTGMDMVFAHINHRNIRSLLKGTVIALVLISFVLILALRSVQLGLISLIPNLVPAALAYGTWGLLIGRVDLSASIVICMSLGIVVDDTVHFLSKYLRARRVQNLSAEDGMRYAFHTVGVALGITTIVLVSGFLVLVGSNFSPTWVTGLLMSITLSYALLADFLFLPPLLLVLSRMSFTKT